MTSPGSGQEAALIDVLLPRTDLGVMLQLSVVITVGGLALFVTRRHHDWRLVVVGVLVLVLAGFGLRALH